MRWYHDHRQDGLTELSDLTLKMLGSPGDQKLKTKAMETYSLLLFLLDMFIKYPHRCGAQAT